MEPNPNDLSDPYKPDPYDDDPPDLECAICFDQFNNVFNTPKILQCKHTFCLECLARMNVKSAQPDTIQCPLCRAYTPLPVLGLPKLANNSEVLSYLPNAMQHVYSIRFNRNKGKLQVKRVPSSAPAITQTISQSLDVGTPGNEARPQGMGRDNGRERSSLATVLQMPLCRAFIMCSVAILTVSLIVIIITKHE